ncbi:TPA: hypothetical protein JBF03_10800 [Legionella pneumophila]|jgi:hypothetical protein|nr:hypothetical protein [Legionella pneumophila]HAU1915545.1 hypothetical protein [Legionella pneumophila]
MYYLKEAIKRPEQIQLIGGQNFYTPLTSYDVLICAPIQHDERVCDYLLHSCRNWLSSPFFVHNRNYNKELIDVEKKYQQLFFCLGKIIWGCNRGGTH